MRLYGDTFIPVIPVDYQEHTLERPFCAADPTCPCHEDQESIQEVAAQVHDGLLTPTEATRTVAGKII